MDIEDVEISAVGLTCAFGKLVENVVPEYR
jgi:hypothetical protein